MVQQKLFLILFSVLLGALPSNVSAAPSCSSVFAQTQLQTNRFHQKSEREKALKIILDGSLNVSRTKVLSRRFMAPESLKEQQISELAEVNFKRAAEYMLENFEHLEVNLATAEVLNKIITKGLVRDAVLGKYDYRPSTVYAHEIDSPHIRGFPAGFYPWLESAATQTMIKKYPVEMAETLHNDMMALDSFPDGNGRTSRLLADLVLIKSGLAPAYYTPMKDYFARGTVRANVAREVRKAYFQEIVERGQAAMESPVVEQPIQVDLMTRLKEILP